MRELALALGWALSSAALAQPPHPQKALILTERAYFRYYYQFGLLRISTEALKAADAKAMSPALVKRLEKQTRRYVRGKDWTRTDWRDEAAYYFSRIGGQVRRDDVRSPYSPPPPAGWMKPDFDDTHWMRHRLGTVAAPEDANDFTFLHRRGIYLRTVFYVPDPARAGELKLRLAYRGGVRVFVNGAELARGHLPAAGKGDPDHAEDYPEQAYVRGPQETYQNRFGVIGEVIGPFADARPYGGYKGFRRASLGGAINQAGWERLQRLRDRRLGPVSLPAELLRTGRNVLAVEIRTSHYHPRVLPGYGGAPNWGIHGGVENFTWAHAGLVSLELRGEPDKVPSAMRRPAGVQAWVADMHDRLYSTEFLPSGGRCGTARFVGAPNGTYSAQIAVGTGRELTGLKASPGPLLSPGGRALPAGALRVLPMAARPISDLGQLASRGMARMSPGARMHFAFQRYGEGPADPRGEWLRRLNFFDHISRTWPEKVPADTCQALWVYLDVPADAKAGKYAGRVTVTADGIDPIPVPVEAEVIGWRVPDPRDFQTFLALEQSPYGVARQYKVPLWSDEHFRLLAESFRQLGRIGNDWLFVPVLAHTEFGNLNDSPVRWIRRRDGSLAFDYRIADRYVDLAVKHMGPPRVICFVVMQGCRNPTAVPLLDEATGRWAKLELYSGSRHFRSAWSAFAASLWGHMSSRGLQKRMLWGFCWDGISDPALLKLLAEFAPEVKWARGCHSRYPDETFHAVSTIILEMLPARSRRGWRNPYLHMVNPRWGNTTACANGTSNPFAFRLLIDRALVAGHRGVARLGADYWSGTWLRGYGRLPYLYAGMPGAFLLWPGARGAESSARFEALREGVQETEARVFLEQALDRGLLARADADRAQRALDAHNRQTLFYPSGDDPPKVYRYSFGWQDRSKRLLAAAAEAAGKVALDTRQAELHVNVPACGKVQVPIRLRNWTADRRGFQADATESWIQPERTQGTVVGQQDLLVTVNAGRLRAQATVTGTVTITDAGSAAARAVRITATVSRLFELLADNTVFNVTAGGSVSRPYLLVNHSATELNWRSEGSAQWMKVEPSSGRLAPAERVFLTVTAAPADRHPAAHKTTLTITAGPARQEVQFTTLVIPPYRRPARPAGRAVALQSVSRRLLKSHRSHGEGWVTGRNTAPLFQAEGRYHHLRFTPTVGRKTFPKAMWVVPRHETTYRLEGTGFTAFSAEVGVHCSTARIGDTSVRANFEIHVDGQVRAQSGLMSADDEPRLLVVDDLTGAKQVKLITRLDRLVNTERVWCNWAEARFYRAK